MRNGKIDPEFFHQYTELAAFSDRIELLSEEPQETENTKIPGKYFREEAFAGKKIEKISLSERIARAKKELSSSGELTRKSIVIQTGCDNFCTFCLTVQAR